MPLTNRTHQALLNSLFGRTSNFGDLDTPPTLYVGLFTAPPAMDGTGGTEVGGGSAGSYARVATDPADWGNATSADPSVLVNAEDIEFPELEVAEEDWGTVTHFGLWDAQVDGNLVGYDVLDNARNPTEGDSPVFPAGSLEAHLSSPD